MIKKFLAAGIIAAVLIIGLGLTAEAHPDNQEKAMKLAEKIKKLDLDDNDLPEVEKVTPQQNPSLFIGPKGQVRIINGTVVAVSSGTGTIPANFTAEVWKIRLSIDTAGARIIPEPSNATSTATSTRVLAIGNRVSVKGTINAETGVVKATSIHDLTARNDKTNELRSKMCGLIDKLRELQQRLGLPLTPAC